MLCLAGVDTGVRWTSSTGGLSARLETLDAPLLSWVTPLGGPDSGHPAAPAQRRPSSDATVRRHPNDIPRDSDAAARGPGAVPGQNGGHDAGRPGSVSDVITSAAFNLHNNVSTLRIMADG